MSLQHFNAHLLHPTLIAICQLQAVVGCGWPLALVLRQKIPLTLWEGLAMGPEQMLSDTGHLDELTAAGGVQEGHHKVWQAP